MKTYAVLFAPDFRLQATMRHVPDLAGRPLALLEIQAAKPRVIEVNDLAAQRAVEPGMTPTQALARCAEVQLLSRNAGHERSAQQTLLHTAETLSPFLESTAPGVVTVDLPAERVFRAEDVAARVIAPLGLLGLEIRVGIAGTPDLALMAARVATPVEIIHDAAAFLASLPLAALEPGENLSGVLKAWGIHTIGQFLALPAAALWERLGPEAVELSTRAQGGRSRPLRLVQPPEFFSEEADLDHPVEMLEPLLFLLRRFLEQIARRLACAYLVAGRLQLVLRFERDEPYQRTFTLPQPTRDVDLLFRMLHTHLENFRSESPITGLELAARPVRPQAQQADLLDRGLRDPHQFAETLARLQALLGSGEVGTPELASSHHPDAFSIRPYNASASAQSRRDDILLGVPWLRFRPPIPARVIMNDAGPAFLYSTRSNGPIREACGPWLLAGNWWEDQHWSREEWDIAMDEGFYRLVQAGEMWFLDGIYA